MAARSITAWALLATALGIAAAHYNLRYPMPYNPIDCNRPECAGPCPPIWKTGRARARNTPSRPSAYWKRGQVVNIEWHRNNHEGGYYRRSLVPVRHMFNAAWHKKTAFEWGCYTQNRFKCGHREDCGTDGHGFAYRNKMRVPNVFPDGDYVFSMVWFGGLHWRRKRALFSDYYTCAYVRIRGGALMKSHRPAFIRGRNHRNVKPGTCASTSAFARQCGGEPCENNSVIEDVPGVFRRGKSPPRVFLRDLDKNALATIPDSALPTSSDAEELRAEKQSYAEARRDARWAREAKKAQMRKTKKPVHKKPVYKKPVHRKPAQKHRAKKVVWRPPHRRQAPKKVWKKPARHAKKVWKRAPKHQTKVWKAPNRKPKQPWRNKCKGKWKAPQPPKGSWGPRRSAKYHRKRLQWWKWKNYCKPRKMCWCW